MITLLAMVLELSFKSQIRLSKPVNLLLIHILVFAVLSIPVLVTKGYCNTLIALCDLTAVITGTVLFLKQLYTK